MKISKSADVTAMKIDAEKGADFLSNPGLKVPSSISDTPGERASNDVAGFSQTKKQPYGKGGSGLGGC